MGQAVRAAFSLSTFFVAVDKESTSPVGANTHYYDISVLENAKYITHRLWTEKRPTRPKLNISH
jgi:hypothetical protein